MESCADCSVQLSGRLDLGWFIARFIDTALRYIEIKIFLPLNPS